MHDSTKNMHAVTLSCELSAAACLLVVGFAYPSSIGARFLSVQFGLDAVYMITAGKSMHGVWNLACQPPCSNFGLSAWIAVFVGLQLILSQVPC